MLLSVRGVRLNVVDSGGSGPAVVFLHGIGGSVADWTPQQRSLVPGHRVVALDARGFGRSDRTYGAMSFADYAADVLDVLDRVEVERPVVVGLSLGGMIAQAVALDAPPGRLAGAVFCATSAQLDPDLRAALDMGRQTLAASGEMGVLDQVFMPLLAGPDVTEATHGWFAGFAESFRTTDPLAFAVGLGAIAGLDHLAALGDLDLPTLVIHGSEDRMVPLPHGEAIAAAVPGSELVVLDGVGHLVNLEAPARFDEALVRFVARVAL